MRERRVDMNWNWDRIAAIAGAAVGGLTIGYVTFVADSLPRALIVIGGILGLAGAAASAVLVLFIYTVIADCVRPALRFRRPLVPMSLSHDEAALIGRRSFRQHPVRFWGGLTLNNRFFVGFMLFDQPTRFTLTDPVQVATHAKRRDVKQARSVRVGSAVGNADAPKAK
jgi:hypothetical protein